MCIARYIPNVAIKYFSYLIDASSSGVFLPEIFSYFWNCVNSDTVEIKFLDNAIDPVQKSFSDKRIILIEVRETSKTTNFDLMLIVPVVDNAIRVIVSALIERCDFVKVHTDVGSVVCNHIKHHPNVLGLSSLN
jgi:hypothetical protein